MSFSRPSSQSTFTANNLDPAGQLSSEQVQQLIAYLSSLLQHHNISPPESNTIAHSTVYQFCGNFSFTYSLAHSIISSDEWILDTRASHHACHNLSFFSHSTPVQNTTVILPNGQSVAINRIGFVHLSSSLVLNNVPMYPCSSSISLALVNSFKIVMTVLIFFQILV